LGKLGVKINIAAQVRDRMTLGAAVDGIFILSINA
jgi:hypothetical protein